MIASVPDLCILLMTLAHKMSYPSLWVVKYKFTYTRGMLRVITAVIRLHDAQAV